ncbi:MAG: sensor histidine kinase, partial [Oscillospiraceae bacterium]
MAQKRITARWLTGSLGVIVVILLLVEIAFAMAVRVFYYNTVQQTLASQANTVTTLLSKYAEDPSVNYQREVRNLIENFEMRDRMELMAVDVDGRVTATSSGFAVTERIEMPDFQKALASPIGVGEYRGEISSENVMAITVLSPAKEETVAGVRLIVSLTRV